MTRWGGAAAVAALTAYSALLLWVELSSSQAAVRPYFADIEGPVPFFAVNTTLSVFLLGFAALLLLFTAAILTEAPARQARPFLLCQAGIFGLLAFDDRFQLHEALNWRLELGGDHYLLIAAGVAQIATILLLFRPGWTSPAAILLFLVGAAFSGAMLLVDILAPAKANLRLSIEDLAKTWGAAMFLAFSWETAKFQLCRSGRSDAERGA
jgi:hypothetical protein